MSTKPDTDEIAFVIFSPAGELRGERYLAFDHRGTYWTPDPYHAWRFAEADMIEPFLSKLGYKRTVRYKLLSFPERRLELC